MLIHRDMQKLKDFYPKSGFFNGFTMQGCIRLAVKLDFISGLLYKAARATGVETFRGVQAQIGEVIGWRNLFWSLTDAMACNPVPWVNGAVLPNPQGSASDRLFMTRPVPRSATSSRSRRVRPDLSPVQRARFQEPGHRQIPAELCARLEWHRLQGAHQDHEAFVDAIGSEFGARHELYERNYSGSHELIRVFQLQQAQGNGVLKAMEALAEQCMADYDENGWKHPAYTNPSDISVLGKKNKPQASLERGAKTTKAIPGSGCALDGFAEPVIWPTTSQARTCWLAMTRKFGPQPNARPPLIQISGR